MGSATGDASKIYSPFGSKPNYTKMQQVSFDNAGNKALGGSIAYDFGHAFAKIWSFRPEPRPVGYAGLCARYPATGAGIRTATNSILGCNTARYRVRSTASASKPGIQASGRRQHAQSAIRASRCPRLHRVVPAALAVRGSLATAVRRTKGADPTNGKLSPGEECFSNAGWTV